MSNIVKLVECLDPFDPSDKSMPTLDQPATRHLKLGEPKNEERGKRTESQSKPNGRLKLPGRSYFNKSVNEKNRIFNRGDEHSQIKCLTGTNIKRRHTTAYFLPLICRGFIFVSPHI